MNSAHMHNLVHSEDCHTAPEPLETLPLMELLIACREHTERFRRGAVNDSRFCLELFRRAIDTGDTEAWRGLVDLYQPLLLARLQQRGVMRAMAEDVVQEAFVALWRKAVEDSFSTSHHSLAQVLNYLWISVRFALINQYRRNREVVLPDDNTFNLLPATGDSQAQVEQRFDAQTVLAEIRRLVTNQEWHILWLRFGHDLTPRVIATQLNLPVQEIHITLANLKRRLRTNRHLRTFMEQGA